MTAAFLTSPSGAATGGTPPSGAAERVSGPTRFATSVAISQKLPVGQNYVILALGTNFPDALAASPASNDTGSGSFAPILLTPGNALDPGVKDEIDRRLNPGDTVLLMGGSAALSPTIDATLTAAGYTALRLTSYGNGSGEPVNRYDTAAALAESMTPGPTAKLPEIIVASGLNFPDALAASPYAALHKVPILLVTPTDIPAETQKFLNNHANSSTTVHVIGGTSAAAAPSGVIVDRQGGANRFDTAVRVAKNLFNLTVGTSDRNDNLILARGDNGGGGADALGGGPLAGSLNAPLLLTDPGGLPTDTAAYVGALGYDQPLRPARSYILGGTTAISADTATSWSNMLLNLTVGGGKSSTFRDLVNGSTTSTPGATTGCVQPTASQTFTWTVTGDLPGDLVVDATFCQVGNPLQAEAATVLPGSTATFTPTGGTAMAGKVTGGSESGQPSNSPFRQVSIDFVIDTANLVGHVVFGNPGTRTGPTDTDGWLALVGGAARQGFDGNYTAFPAAVGCGSVSYDGAIGAEAVTITGMTVCKTDTAGNIWRISGGTVSGGPYTGKVVSGVRDGNNLGLALRTNAGLVDVFAVLSGLHSAGSSSPAMVQSLPENDPTTTVTVGAGAAGAMGDGPGCVTFFTGATFTAVPNPPTFDGTLNINNNVAECQTDGIATAGLGIVEPTIVGDVGTNGSDSRTVLYTLPSGETFRGRIATSAFVVAAGVTTYYLTLIIEENNLHATPGPIPPAATVDDPGNSFTVVRVVTGASGAVTFAR